MSRSARTIPTTVLAGMAVVVVVLTGCSSSGNDDKSPPPKSKSPSSSQAVAVPQNPEVPTSVANKTALRKNVVVSHCARVDGGWQATGTAANKGKKSASYKITVFFTSPKATVEDFAVTKVTVAAGKTEKWSAHKTFKALDGTLCVLRGVS